MSKFCYQLDDCQFRVPWSRPDMDRLELWFAAMRNRFDKIEFKCMLHGGFWSNESHLSWDVDLFVIPLEEHEGDPYPALNRVRLRGLHDAIREGIALAIQHYRFLLEVTATTDWHLCEVARLCRAFERGHVDDLVLDPTVSEATTGYDVHQYVMKLRHGVREFEHHRKVAATINLGEGKFLHKKSFTNLDKQTEHMKRGRIYYDPVLLAQLFD